MSHCLTTYAPIKNTIHLWGVYRLVPFLCEPTSFPRLRQWSLSLFSWWLASMPTVHYTLPECADFLPTNDTHRFCKKLGNSHYFSRSTIPPGRVVHHETETKKINLGLRYVSNALLFRWLQPNAMQKIITGVLVAIIMQKRKKRKRKKELDSRGNQMTSAEQSFWWRGNTQNCGIAIFLRW